MTTITLPYPPSTNTYWKKFRNRIVKSDEARQYQANVGWQLRIADTEMLDGGVALELRVYRPQRRRDLDNCVKVLLDAMQGYLYENDDQVREIHAYLDDDQDEPRVEVKAWGVD